MYLILLFTPENLEPFSCLSSWQQIGLIGWETVERVCLQGKKLFQTLMVLRPLVTGCSHPTVPSLEEGLMLASAGV